MESLTVSEPITDKLLVSYASRRSSASPWSGHGHMLAKNQACGIMLSIKSQNLCMEGKDLSRKH